MKHLLANAAKLFALWLAMMAGTVLSGILVHPVLPPGKPDGPMSVLPAMMLVNGLGAIVTAALASRLTLGSLRKFLVLILVIFTVETALSSIESVVFRQFLGLSLGTLTAIAGAGSIRALVTALVATMLWRRSGERVSPISVRPVVLLGLIGLYVALYFTAGMLIAWRSEIVRQYYHAGVGIHLPALFALQVARGALWAGLATVLAVNLRGKTVAVASWTGAAFAVLMAAPLIYPSSFMPWAVRLAHLLELSVSNFVFGMTAVILLRGPARASLSPVGEVVPQNSRAGGA
jgi:hypothetical protein